MEIRKFTKYFRIMALVALVVVIFHVLFPSNALANKFGQISVSSAMGENGTIPATSIDPQVGLTISFLRTNKEFVQQVRVKKGLVDLQFDAALPSASESSSSGATVIYVSPKVTRSSEFVMSIVTVSAFDNARRLYQLRLRVAPTEFYTIEIVPDAVLAAQSGSAPPPPSPSPSQKPR